jgi:S-adenosylmethionine:tRNA ribosyltransferase-isomerase
MDLSLELFDFDLPENLIAQKPLDKRDSSNLLLVDSAKYKQQKLGKGAGKESKKEIKDFVQDAKFVNIVDQLEDGDLLVFNNSFVIPARMYGQKSTGGAVEILVEHIQESIATNVVEALVKSNKPLAVGMQVALYTKEYKKGGGSQDCYSQYSFEVIEKKEGSYMLEFCTNISEVVDEIGHIPLPPYIKREDNSSDKDRYQNIYANSDNKGSVAAPTAGLHFSQEIMNAIRKKRVEVAFVSLHVGAGTFRPVKTDNIEKHNMHSEYYAISEETARKIANAKNRKSRVIAVGTTSLRCLEGYCLQHNTNAVGEGSGNTDIFIYPPFDFKVVDCLITNFHTPKSTLLMLLSAFVQYKTNTNESEAIELTKQIYKHAIDSKYRFFSYGDSMAVF